MSASTRPPGVPRRQVARETLGGKGKVVAINGVAGQSGERDARRRLQERLQGLSDIQVVNEVNANWTRRRASRAMQNILPPIRA